MSLSVFTGRSKRRYTALTAILSLLSQPGACARQPMLVEGCYNLLVVLVADPAVSAQVFTALQTHNDAYTEGFGRFFSSHLLRVVRESDFPFPPASPQEVEQFNRVMISNRTAVAWLLKVRHY